MLESLCDNGLYHLILICAIILKLKQIDTYNSHFLIFVKTLHNYFDYYIFIFIITKLNE